ncbi:hypothetical protein KIH39_19895 [Telmatocola sphagniphila]|uniref:Uncharacterized protein n=1 Tax=Telmatocola sphagniphila TaxID=1123043 RepID=A0A8E6EXC0_9BACT|nr:hypothetical protein [Telmatocola sphagniphila]QVL31091.1 hypothetical protein KIH39_19895 [Telmatocola sphagniphila]
MRLLPRNRWLRRSLYLFLLVLLGSAGLYGYRHLVYRESAKYEDRILAELNQIDPDWAWEKMIAQSPNLPDDKNGYLHLEALQKKYSSIDATLIPDLPQDKVKLPGRPKLDVLNFPQLQDPKFKKELDEFLSELRKQVEYPQGWIPITWGQDAMTGTKTPPPLTQQAYFLIWDARRQALLNNPDLAIEDLRALLAVAQASRTPGMLIYVIVSWGQENNTVATLEQILAWSTPSASTLKKLQEDLERTLQKNPLVNGFRFERASSYQMMLRIGNQLSNGVRPPGAVSRNEIKRFFLNIRYPMYAPADRAHLLEDITKVIEQLKNNSPELKTTLAELEKEKEEAKARQNQEEENDAFSNVRPSTWMSALLKPSLTGMLKSDFNWKSTIRCGIGALAAERYRQSKNRWPENWEELVPEYLQEVPEDPWSDKPLRMRKTEEGLTIYSVGANGVDDGGLPEVLKTKLDLGFRLFNPQKRSATP